MLKIPPYIKISTAVFFALSALGCSSRDVPSHTVFDQIPPILTPQLPNVLPNSPPPGEIDRYTVVGVYNASSRYAYQVSENRVAIVSILGNVPTTPVCGITVRFISGDDQRGIAQCAISRLVDGGGTIALCSSPIPDSICNYYCGGTNTFYNGYAVVSSTDSEQCANISVDAQELYYRAGTEPQIEALRKLTVVKAGQPNIGD